MAEIFTYQYVKNFIEVESGSGCRLLSEEYINSKAKLKIQCECGNIFETTWDAFHNLNKRTCGCNIGKIQWNSYNVKRFCKSNSIEFLDNVYSGNFIEYNFRCNCGNIFKRRWSSVVAGSYDCGCESGRINWDIDKVRDYCKSVNIVFLSDSYKNGKIVYKFKCKCGNEFYRSWGDFYNSKRYYCDCESIKTNWNIDNIKNKCIELKTDFLSNSYNVATDTYLFKCSCGNTYTSTWATIISGQSTPKCEICSNKISWDIEKVNDFVKKNSSSILLSTSYISNRSKLKFKCSCGEIFFASISKFKDRNKRQCNKCSNKVPWTEDEIAKTVNEGELSTYVKLVDEKPHAGAKIQLLCNCGNHFITDIRHFIHDDKKECYQCKMQEGYHSKTLAIRNKERWINKPARIYFIECSNDKESFFKIGITTRLVQRRIYDIPYDCKILKTIETNLYDAIFHESRLHELHKEYRYIPDAKFGGWTECYSKLLLQNEKTA